MLTAITNKGEKTVGWKADKKESYYCPSCEEKLILRQGEIKVHHFAHTTETECGYMAGETEEHLWMKMYLYEEFSKSNLFKKIEPEYRIEDRISDIYLVNKQDKQIAVECQISNLDINEFRKKTAYYSYKGIYSLWIFSENNELDKRLIRLVNTNGSRLNYTPSEIEKRCHRWFYGRFYYFYNDKIYAIHLHPIEKWVPSSCEECLDEPSCTNKNQGECAKYSPGYFYRAKESREVSIYSVNNFRMMCVDRKDKLRIAKFNEPVWWKI